MCAWSCEIILLTNELEASYDSCPVIRLEEGLCKLAIHGLRNIALVYKNVDMPLLPPKPEIHYSSGGHEN